MRVGIFAKPLLNPKSGSGSHLKGFLETFSRQDYQDVDLVLITTKPLPDELLFGFTNIVISKYIIVGGIQIFKMNLDIIHFHPFTLKSYFWIPGVLKVATVHGASRSIIPDEFSKVEVFHSTIRNHFFRILDHIFTVSVESSKYLQKCPGMDQRKITITPNGINSYLTKSSEQSSSIAGEDYVLHLSNYSSRKNPDAVFRAFSYAKKLGLEKKLVLAGNGWENKYTKSLANSLGISNSVEYVGFLSDKDVGTLYKNASVFLFPSFYEGFGMPVLEAFYFGTPVVASNIGAIEEVSGGAAKLCSPDDYNGLGNAILSFCSDENYSKCKISEGFKRVEKFNWVESVDSTVSVYRQLYIDSL